MPIFCLMPFSFSSVDGFFWLMTTGTLEKALTIHSPLFFRKITLTSSHLGFKCTESTQGRIACEVVRNILEHIFLFFLPPSLKAKNAGAWPLGILETKMADERSARRPY